MNNDKIKIESEYEKYLREATEDNDTYAMYNLGIMYFSGELGKVNYEEAAKWYEKAANLGLKQAQYNLGTMYDRGQGVKQNFKKAMELYQLAAKQGDSLAKQNIGALYENGEGVEKNIDEAKKWFAEACLDGVELGCQSLNRLSSREEIKHNQEIKFLRNIGNQGGLDGKSIGQIRDYLKQKGIKETFDVWHEVWKGYVGIALEDIAYKLYDFAQNINELEGIVYCSSDNNYQNLVKTAISNLKNGKNKPKRLVIDESTLLEEDILHTLESLDFELELIENSWDYFITKKSFILSCTLEGIIARFGEALQGTENKSINNIFYKLINIIESCNISSVGNILLLRMEIKNLRAEISAAKRYYKLSSPKNRLKSNRNIRHNTDNLIQLRNEITQIDQKISQLEAKKRQTYQSSYREVESLNNYLLNLRERYNRTKIAYETGKRSSGHKEMKKLQEKIGKAVLKKNTLESAHNSRMSEKMESFEIEKAKLLELKENLENELSFLENPLESKEENLELEGGLQAYKPDDIDEQVRCRQKKLEDKIDLEASVNLNPTEIKYNKLKNNYYSQVRSIVDILKQSPEYSFDTDKFESLLALLDNLPTLNPIDPKVANASRLLTEFFDSFGPMNLIHGDDLDNNHYHRFLLLLEKIESYLELSQNTLYRQGLAIYSNNLISKEFLERDEEIDITVFEEVDEDIIDNNLYGFIQDKIEIITAQGLLNEQDISKIREELDPLIYQRYEQLPDFDLDEVVNSVNNSIKTGQWFLTNKGALPVEAKHDLLCCFLKKVQKIERNVIPLTHDFYCLIDEEDKNTLIDIFNQLIDLNNYYTGMHIKVALTIGSHDKSFQKLKTTIFDFAQHLSDKYFYSRFFNDVYSAEEATEKFLSLFNNLISITFESSTQSSFTWGLTFAFLDAVNWFVLLNSSYGGVPIFDESEHKAHILSQKSQISNYTSYIHMIQAAYGQNPVLSNQLINEYQTTYLLGNIDLRFKKNIIRPLSYQQFDNDLMDISNDLREMRRLLVKNYNPVDSIIELDLQLSDDEGVVIGNMESKIYALWQWETYGDGLGRICLGYDKDEMIRQASKLYRRDAQYNAVLRVNWNGKISPTETPWVTTDKMALIGYDCPVDLNFHVMHKFHELFYSWYVSATQKIKLRKAKQNESYDTQSSTEELVYDEVDETNIILNEALAQITFDEDLIIITDKLQAEDKSVRKSKIYFNSSIKSTKFFSTLKDHFDINITQGKGSEKKAVKKGGKIYRLGHHGKEVVYPVNYVRKVLNRLDIDFNDFIVALTGKVVT